MTRASVSGQAGRFCTQCACQNREESRLPFSFVSRNGNTIVTVGGKSYQNNTVAVCPAEKKNNSSTHLISRQNPSHHKYGDIKSINLSPRAFFKCVKKSLENCFQCYRCQMLLIYKDLYVLNVKLA